MGVYPHVAQEVAGEFDHVTAVFYNPNIAPESEYIRRRDACAEYAKGQKIRFFEICPMNEWELGQNSVDITDGELSQATDSAEQQRESRCRACYRLRLERVAIWAIEHEYDALATTLSISPWQNLDAINQVGEDALKAFCDVHFIKRDFREHYREAQNMAQDLGVYRQNYCGCLASKTEADAQRATRRAAKKERA